MIGKAQLQKNLLTAKLLSKTLNLNSNKEIGIPEEKGG